jgi:hypothetical protein
VGDERDTVVRAPSRSVEGNLIHVLDEDVGAPVQPTTVVAIRKKGEGVPRSDTVNVDAVERGASGTIGPPTTEQRHGVTARRKTAEDFVEVYLRASSEWVLAILPVDDQNAHYIRPSRRASASRTPLTNLALFTLP